ncbi:ABC transporter permease [Fimbriimonas ginsengisoli]|uniref:Transport permease protein n=1 Tax=Fimbriimonas ginsengisoli Gsoil 348 TaxID=661478 RepID=A0A068NY37_FIMGI|nr:ABC transporter permease [Fimbriimonas ginsengisoli]AIE86609.1 ABC-2 type transporter [Fimbriimonas ginsengisoli Gsoil 348]
MSTFFSDWYYLSIRSIKQIWRPLLALIPSLFIPIFFFVVNSSSLDAFSKVPGFPPSITYRDFIAPTALFTAVFFSSGNAGIELVQDISNGYFKKLLIMPISRLTIILGRLTEVAVQAVMQGTIVVVLLLLVGVRIQTGVLGLLAIFAMLMIFAMAWSCVSMISALRTQNARLVQSLFVVVFPFLYLTTSQAPMPLLPPTFRLIASYNPVTYIIEGVRALVLTGWGNPAIWQGFLVATTLFVIMVTLTLGSFKKALR